MNSSISCKQTIAVAVALFSFLASSGWSSTKSIPEKESSAGARLLDSLVSSFKEMAVSGKGGYEEVNEVLQKSMAGLKKARELDQVDAVFFKRYKRMLTIMKLAIIDTPYDPEGILDDFILREINAFDEDITGLKSERNDRGIGVVAEAIAEEILNLHIYLDGLKKRDQLIKKYKLY